MLTLRLSHARSADSLNRSARLLADVGVRLIKGVSPLAMRLGGVALELGIRGAVKILGVRLGHEMSRVAAGRGIARVAGLHASRHRATGELQSQAVSEPRLPFGARAYAEVAVARRKPVSLPWPTSSGASRLIDLRPKPLLQRPDHLFGAMVDERVAMPLETSVVHPAPTPFINRLQAIGYGTCHVHQYTPCRRVA